MSKIRSKETIFELNFIKKISKRTRFKFETNVVDILGKPDIIFRKKKICIFLDSDFWHGWQFPRWRHKMKDSFWIRKIDSNRKRDRRITKSLRLSGWQVIRLWEHQIKYLPEESVREVILRLHSTKNKQKLK